MLSRNSPDLSHHLIIFGRPFRSAVGQLACAETIVVFSRSTSLQAHPAESSPPIYATVARANIASSASDCHAQVRPVG